VAERLGLARDGTRTAYGEDFPLYRLSRDDWEAERAAGRTPISAEVG
jgi:hypothetical protein